MVSFSGYVAPEYALLGQLTEKADVFSYGVVLLELISGRFNIRPDLLGEQAYLLQWVQLLFPLCRSGVFPLMNIRFLLYIIPL